MSKRCETDWRLGENKCHSLVVKMLAERGVSRGSANMGNISRGERKKNVDCMSCKIKMADHLKLKFNLDS